MTLDEIKEKIWTLSPDERLQLSHLLLHIQLQEDPAYLAEMNRRMEEMDAGKKVSLEELERRHNLLVAEGR